MPYRPASPCAYKGCPELTHERFCPEHANQQRPRDYRPSARQRGYTSEWDRIRAEVLKQDPYCRMCGQVATDVDHIIPIRRGGTHHPLNLQPLCRSCHNRKTRRQA